MKSIFTFVIAVFSFSVHAQFADCGLSQKDFKEFLKGTTHIVVLENDPEYNSNMKEFIERYWTITDFDFVEEEEFLKKEYRRKNKEEFYIYPVELTGTVRALGVSKEDGLPGSFNIAIGERGDGATAIAVFRANKLFKAVKEPNFIHTSEKFTLAYFSFVRKYDLQMFKDYKLAFVKDFNENPMANQVQLAMMYIHNLLKKRETTKERHFIACNSFFEVIAEMMNDPKQIRNKTILINSLYLNDIEESDISDKLTYKFKIADSEEIRERVADRDEEYALLTGRATGRGYIVSIMDLGSGECIYYEMEGGGRIKKKHFKSISKAIKKGKN